MKIDTNFLVPVPPEAAWPLLLDVPRIAPCMPGASLTEDLGERRYKGQATVKVGPLQLQFAGEAQITTADEAARTALVVAKGADAKGRGSASANVEFRLVPEGNGTRVNVATDLNLVGAVAQYGRAAGLLKEIANQIVKQFADNLRDEIGRSPALQTAAGAPSPLGEAPGTPPAAPGVAAAAGSPAPAKPRPASASGAARATSTPAARPAAELSGLAVLWAALKAIVGRWLGRSDNVR
jgi:carbon monoxide dehydrogenase subunit G